MSKKTKNNLKSNSREIVTMNNVIATQWTTMQSLKII